jgi:hypothetical protein
LLTWCPAEVSKPGQLIIHHAPKNAQPMDFVVNYAMKKTQPSVEKVTLGAPEAQGIIITKCWSGLLHLTRHTWPVSELDSGQYGGAGAENAVYNSPSSSIQCVHECYER